MIAEVNSDLYVFYKQPNGKFELNNIDTKAVGTSISTKQVGANKREDVILAYKYPEGSKAERAASLAPQADQSVQFSVKFSQEVYNIGDTISIQVTSTAKKAAKSGNNTYIT